MKASFTSDLTLFIRGRNSARGKNNDLVYVNYRQLGGDSFHSSGYYYNFFFLFFLKVVLSDQVVHVLIILPRLYFFC